MHSNEFEPGNDDPSLALGDVPEHHLETVTEEQSEDVNSSPAKRAREDSGLDPESDTEQLSEEF